MGEWQLPELHESDGVMWVKPVRILTCCGCVCCAKHRKGTACAGWIIVGLMLL